MSSQSGQLVKMANQIALNFGELRDPEKASQKTAEHIQKFWTRDMREQLAGLVASGTEDISPAVVAALAGQAQSTQVNP
jgi:formate dehydrogenase subunit delta